MCGETHKKNHQCTNGDCSNRNMERIVQIIDEAQYSIDIAIYTFTCTYLKQALKRAFDRGVALRLISDPEMNISSASQIANIHGWGVEYRSPNTTTAVMHHKFMLIDVPARVKEIKRKSKGKGKSCSYRSMVVNGSLNWTLQGFYSNWESCVISEISEEINAFYAEFERMWNTFPITSATF